MDNFEGGVPMTPSAISQTQSHQLQPVNIPRSEEIELSQEVEVPVTRAETSEKPEAVQQQKQVADELLADSKNIGLAETFRKLATGQYRSDRNSEAETQDDQQVDSFESSNEDNTPEIDVDRSVERKDIQEDQNSEDFSDIQSRKEEMVAYVAEQVEADPLMKQKLGEVASEMIARGEDIDPNFLREEALSRYLKEKENVEPMTLEEKVVSIEQQFAELLNENEELRNELKEFKALIKQQSETMNTMALALLEMAKKMHQEKEDEEEKMSLLELLIKLMGMLLQEMTKTDQGMQNADQKKSQDKKTPPVFEIPRFKLKEKAPQELPKAA